MDLESEKVIAEWGCKKDDVDIPMSDIIAGAKVFGHLFKPCFNTSSY
jgi:hypothetical protein